MWSSKAAAVVARDVVAPGFIAIGSGPAGLTAAETFRQKHPKIPVRILTSDPALPYAKPPLSEGLSARPRPQARPAQLRMVHAETASRLHRGITVDHIDLGNREVVTAAGRRYTLLASGVGLRCDTRPARRSRRGGRAVPAIVRRRRRPADGRQELRLGRGGRRRPDRVRGGIDACASRGVETTLVAPEPVPVQRRFGLEAGERVAKMLSDIGVRFIGSASVAAVEDGEVTLDTGEALEAELVVVRHRGASRQRARRRGGPRHRGRSHRRRRAYAHLGTQRVRRRRCRARLQRHRGTTDTVRTLARRDTAGSHRGDESRQATRRTWDDVPEFTPAPSGTHDAEVPRLGHGFRRQPG